MPGAVARRRLDDEEPNHIVTFRPGKEENILYGINKASVLSQRFVTDVLKKDRLPETQFGTSRPSEPSEMHLHFSIWRRYPSLLSR